jgi:hypothetical protein
VLLVAALIVKYNKPKGVIILATVFSLGLLIHSRSTYTQLTHYLNGDPDPGILISGFVLIVNVILLVYVLIAFGLLMKGAFRRNSHEKELELHSKS